MSAAVATGPSVRVARPADLDAAGALTAEAYLADRLLADDDYESELRDARRRAEQAVLLVACVGSDPDSSSGSGSDEVVVGTLTAAPYGSSYAEIAEPGEWELRMLAVAPEARRRGIAEQLVLAALREAVASGTRTVVLSTLDTMHVAHRLYERIGFEPVPARDWRHEGVRLAVHVWTAPPQPGVLVEAATWPPVRTVQLDGWRLGLSGGLTKRANSVLALDPPADLDGAIDRVEAVYAAQGLPAVFRVETEGWHRELSRSLGARGYQVSAATDVLVRPLADGVLATPSLPHLDIAVAETPGAAWLAAWAAGKGGRVDLARAILTGAPAQYLSALRAGRLVGIARIAYDQGWVALSSLAVEPEARRSGVAGALSSAALNAAARHGARRAFLQVEAENTAAWRLYVRLGFRPAARYAYLSQG